MATLYGLENKEVVRIKVKKCEGLLQPEYKKLCVDPQITSFDMLQRLLARAFNIKGDFTISYLARDDYGQEMYLSLLSDWDIDAAFLSAADDPYLRLKVDLKPFEDTLEDWDVVPHGDYNSQHAGAKALGSAFLDRTLLGSITGTITSQVGRTVSHVTRAMGLKHDESKRPSPTKPMMSDAEFHNFLDSVGHLVQPQQFRLSVYQGGVEPALRRVVWRHLLNAYPEGLSGRERFEYMKTKVNEYYRLRDEWRDLFTQGKDTEVIRGVTSMVKKDVLRTDRMHPYFAGEDDNQNVVALFNLLVTFALTHPEVSYCQGMSDIASPILVVQNDEAHAYICFCGVMKRLRGNFLLDGEAMTTKFQHLSVFLQHQDPVFFSYLKEHNADDMFFCYRWLLLEMKREFPLEDAMYMLEVMWSSLPPDPPELEISLVDPIYKEHGLKAYTISSPTYSNNVYMHLMSQRKRLSNSLTENSTSEKQMSDSCDGSGPVKSSIPSPEVPSNPSAITPCEDVRNIDPKDFVEMNDAATAVLQEKSVIIDRSLESSGEEEFPLRLNGAEDGSVDQEHVISNGKVSKKVSSPKNEAGQISECPTSEAQSTSATSLSEKVTDLQLTEKDNADFSRESSSNASVPDSAKTTHELHVPRPSEIQLRKSYDEANAVASTEPTTSLVSPAPPEINSCEEAVEHPSIDFVKVTEKPPRLPPPQAFGAGNPFLICLCLSLLLQHRDHIMQNRMDYNELAMHFDKMVRKQNVHRVVHQAQTLYAGYLKYQQGLMDREDQDDDPRL